MVIEIETEDIAEAEKTTTAAARDTMMVTEMIRAANEGISPVFLEQLGLGGSPRFSISSSLRQGKKSCIAFAYLELKNGKPFIMIWDNHHGLENPLGAVCSGLANHSSRYGSYHRKNDNLATWPLGLLGMLLINVDHMGVSVYLLR